jgi:hypothetical protein
VTYNALALTSGASAGRNGNNGGERDGDGEIKGEAETGFEKRGRKGPFECGNCGYFERGDACTQATMKEKSKEPRHSDGSVVVAADDCCKYLDRKGKK